MSSKLPSRALNPDPNTQLTNKPANPAKRWEYRFRCTFNYTELKKPWITDTATADTSTTWQLTADTSRKITTTTNIVCQDPFKTTLWHLFWILTLMYSSRSRTGQTRDTQSCKKALVKWIVHNMIPLNAHILHSINGPPAHDIKKNLEQINLPACRSDQFVAEGKMTKRPGGGAARWEYKLHGASQRTTDTQRIRHLISEKGRGLFHWSLWR